MTLNKDKKISELEDKNKKLSEQLQELISNSNTPIIKQLPDGTMELNGIPMDNTTEVEYYNSSKCSFSELTMYRIGKEMMSREMDKLIQSHMSEIDDYQNQINEHLGVINELTNQITELTTELTKMTNAFDQSQETLSKTINEYNNKIDSLSEEYNESLEKHINMIKLLDSDIQIWKTRFLESNHVNFNGDIETIYGIIKHNNENDDVLL